MRRETYMDREVFIALAQGFRADSTERPRAAYTMVTRRGGGGRCVQIIQRGFLRESFRGLRHHREGEQMKSRVGRATSRVTRRAGYSRHCPKVSSEMRRCSYSIPGRESMRL